MEPGPGDTSVSLSARIHKIPPPLKRDSGISAVHPHKIIVLNKPILLSFYSLRSVATGRCKAGSRGRLSRVKPDFSNRDVVPA